MRSERRIEDGVLLEHVAHETGVARVRGDRVEQPGELHLAVVLLVAFVLVPARLTRRRHIDGFGECRVERELRPGERPREQGILCRRGANRRPLGFRDEDAISGRTGIAPRTAVDVGDDAHVVAWVAAGAGTK